jgi:hypothetical protein
MGTCPQTWSRLLAILGLAMPCFAQAPASTDPQTSKGETLRYQIVTEGIRVLKLWEVKSFGEVQRWPEIAVLRLSSKWHDQFHADPTKFLNTYKIFSKPVRRPVAGGGCAMVEEGQGRIVGWTATVVHYRPSVYN